MIFTVLIMFIAIIVTCAIYGKYGRNSMSGPKPDSFSKFIEAWSTNNGLQKQYFKQTNKA